MLITHDWGVVADIGDRVVVMYAGEVVEQADVGNAFKRPRFPYTLGLLAANPSTARVGSRLPSLPGRVPSRFVAHGLPLRRPLAFIHRSMPVWCARDADDRLGFAHSVCAHHRARRAGSGALMSGATSTNPFRPCSRWTTSESVYRGRRRQPVHFAVDGVGLRVERGRTTGLVGESGAGKSTLAHVVLGLVPLVSGRIRFLGQDITELSAVERRALATTLQAVYPDPNASLNPSYSRRVEPGRTDACPRRR